MCIPTGPCVVPTRTKSITLLAASLALTHVILPQRLGRHAVLDVLPAQALGVDLRQSVARSFVHHLCPLLGEGVERSLGVLQRYPVGHRVRHQRVRLGSRLGPSRTSLRRHLAANAPRFESKNACPAGANQSEEVKNLSELACVDDA